MGLLLSPGYSLTLWSQPDTGLQHVTTSNPLTLELPLSGYYGCRGGIPSHHLPPECGALPGRVPTPGWPSMGHSLCRWSRGPAHTVWHRPGSPRVPPGWCRGTCTNTHGNTMLELNTPQKTLPGPSKKVTVPAPGRPPSQWLPTSKGVTVWLPAFISLGARSHF